MEPQGSVDPLRLIPRDVHRLSVKDFHAMIDAGVFEEKAHIELLEGILVEKMPSGPPHAGIITRLNGALMRGMSDRFEVRVQLPLTLSDRSEPEPDLAVVRAPVRLAEHPRSALLVIEVARSSLRKDREIKAGIYARSRIPDYWVIDVRHQRVEVFRDPDAHARRYLKVASLGLKDRLKPLRLPGPTFSIEWLFR